MVSQDYVAPQFQLWTTEVGDIMQPVLEVGGESNIASLLETQPYVEAHAGESVAAVAHRLLEKKADYALIMNTETPPQPIGVVRIADVLALEEERVRNHDVRERHQGAS
ncbi:MAG TPA: hypothetical protein VIE13_11675 [Terriglobales bacterium]